jgi:hypothetical protein
MRIPANITIFQHVLPDRVGVVIAKPIAEVVSFTTKLSLPRDGIQFVGVGIDAKITTAKRNARLESCPFSPETGGEGGRRPDEGA